jgi:hypothetical protein
VVGTAVVAVAVAVAVGFEGGVQRERFAVAVAVAVALAVAEAVVVVEGTGFAVSVAVAGTDGCALTVAETVAVCVTLGCVPAGGWGSGDFPPFATNTTPITTSAASAPP